jgi:hypothetical protein
MAQSHSKPEFGDANEIANYDDNVDPAKVDKQTSVTGLDAAKKAAQ